MKKIHYLLLVLVLFSCSSQNLIQISKIREKQLKVQTQDNALDFDRMKDELSKKRNSVGPFTYGVFPYPKYDSISKENNIGFGNGGNKQGIDINGKKIVYASFAELKNNLNSFRVKKDSTYGVFFTIVVLTDYIDEKEYSTMQTQIVSRNFPDVIGQGYIKTQNNKIDYTAFITLENDQFAIVNMKLFNLKFGNVILIAPQKDGSLRSMQLKNGQNLTLDNLKNYIEAIIKKPDIIEFFTNKNTI